MRKLEYSLNRETLHQIYILFLRPLLEYASVVWDGCTNYEKDTLDKIRQPIDYAGDKRCHIISRF
jgi:hypothetical protein